MVSDTSWEPLQALETARYKMYNIIYGADHPVTIRPKTETLKTEKQEVQNSEMLFQKTTSASIGYASPTACPARSPRLLKQTGIRGKPYR